MDNKFVMSPKEQKCNCYVRFKFNVGKLVDYIAKRMVLPDKLNDDDYHYHNEEIEMSERNEDIEFLNRMREIFKDRAPTIKLVDVTLSEDNYENIEFVFMVKELIGETQRSASRKDAPCFNVESIHDLYSDDD